MEKLLESLVNMCLACLETVFCVVFVFVSACDATSQLEEVIKRDLFWSMLLYVPVENRVCRKNDVKSVGDELKV